MSWPVIVKCYYKSYKIDGKITLALWLRQRGTFFDFGNCPDNYQNLGNILKGLTLSKHIVILLMAFVFIVGLISLL